MPGLTCRIFTTPHEIIPEPSHLRHPLTRLVTSAFKQQDGEWEPAFQAQGPNDSLDLRAAGRTVGTVSAHARTVRINSQPRHASLEGPLLIRSRSSLTNF